MLIWGENEVSLSDLRETRHQNYVTAMVEPIANAVSALPFTAELIVKPGQMRL